jgi:hypothetical protein
MKDDDRILDEERLAAWPAAEPPADFADRVMTARVPGPGDEEPRPARGGWKRPAIAGGLAALAVAAAVLVVALRRPELDAGALVATARVEVALGTRALAVAEPEAALSWRLEGSQGRVEQTRGDVFYRVERGGRFVVATPAGDVIVKGTCFRVEVMDMKLGKQTLGGAAAGALVTAAVLVTVYEGRVSLANPRGATEIAAGEHASAGGGEAPGPARPTERRAVPAPAVATAGATETAPPALTREQLLARDGEQRQQITALRTQVQALEAELAKVKDRERSKSKSFYRPTKEELLEMTRSCTIQFDSPPLSLEPIPFNQKMAEKFVLRPDEVVAIQRVHRDVATRALAQLRAIYSEVTGQVPPDDMIGHSLLNEIEQKTGSDEMLEARKQLSYERAGLLPTPENLNARPPGERALRVMSAVGDEMERELEKAIGPVKAGALRAANDGWPSHSTMSGCSSSDDDER